MSRQEYLKKREEAKLEELKEALEDEKYLFQVRVGFAWSRCVSDSRVVVHMEAGSSSIVRCLVGALEDDKYLFTGVWPLLWYRLSFFWALCVLDSAGGRGAPAPGKGSQWRGWRC